MSFAPVFNPKWTSRPTKWELLVWPLKEWNSVVCNHRKVQGHTLPHIGHNVAHYESIWLTLIFWSQCLTLGILKLGQPELNSVQAWPIQRNSANVVHLWEWNKRMYTYFRSIDILLFQWNCDECYSQVGNPHPSNKMICINTHTYHVHICVRNSVYPFCGRFY